MRATTARRRVFVIGGATGNSQTLVPTVEAYTPSTNTWATMADMPTAEAYTAAALVNTPATGRQDACAVVGSDGRSTSSVGSIASRPA